MEETAAAGLAVCLAEAGTAADGWEVEETVSGQARGRPLGGHAHITRRAPRGPLPRQPTMAGGRIKNGGRLREGRCSAVVHSTSALLRPLPQPPFTGPQTSCCPSRREH